MRFEPRALRNAFGAFMTGVTVVTTMDAEGKPVGFTANSFTSVSIDPPLLLVCLARSSRNFATLTEGRGFAVNILAEDQQDISNRFARPSEDRFAEIAWQPGPYGSPVLGGTAAWFDCSRFNVVDAGDHVILIGEVQAFESSERAGLGYARGGYFTPSLADRALAGAHDLRQTIGLIALAGQSILLRERADGTLAIPAADLTETPGQLDIREQLAALAGVPVHDDFIYAVYEDTVSRRQQVVYRSAVSEPEAAAGTFFPIHDLPLARVSDPAARDMLKRFSAEADLGNYGIYIGNQEKGRVHAQPVRG
jgi:flavin reductase (DIM6/NTAB) family NADH-FMN oxidoreductase RutF